jgi:hypothetical protein
MFSRFKYERTGQLRDQSNPPNMLYQQTDRDTEIIKHIMTLPIIKLLMSILKVLIYVITSIAALSIIRGKYRIMTVLKVETDIITSIASSLIGRAAILVITYIKTFKIDINFIIGNVIMCLIISVSRSVC